MDISVYINFVDTTGQRTRLYPNKRVLTRIAPYSKFYTMFLHLVVCFDCECYRMSYITVIVEAVTKLCTCNDIKSLGSKVTYCIHCLVFSNPARANFWISRGGSPYVPLSLAS
jgi:hypothetical protein